MKKENINLTKRGLVLITLRRKMTRSEQEV
jgi:hypothetical protein